MKSPRQVSLDTALLAPLSTFQSNVLEVAGPSEVWVEGAALRVGALSLLEYRGSMCQRFGICPLRP
jgi:hypothetical protein